MADPDELRQRLCALQDRVLAAYLAARADGRTASTEVVGRTAADVSYALDRVADSVLLPWFDEFWPAAEPVWVVSEGLDDPVAFGHGEPQWTCIVDTVDGTRGLMYDKRAAWSLAAIAPAGGSLADVVAAAMSELPPSKQWASDRYSAVRGSGPRGVIGTRTDVRQPGAAHTPLHAAPSAATDLEHGFASFSRFLPAGKTLVAEFEGRVWEALYGRAAVPALPIFEDQYLATGGQFHELLAGHDRLLGDVRPLALRTLGLSDALVCHPYDCCTALVLQEAGCVVVGADGAPLDVPLDTTSPVSWIGVANRELADRVLPAVFDAIAASFPRARTGPRSWPPA